MIQRQQQQEPPAGASAPLMKASSPSVFFPLPPRIAYALLIIVIVMIVISVVAFSLGKEGEEEIEKDEYRGGNRGQREYRGPRGLKGEAGSPGEKGEQGPVGPQGERGLPGEKGQRGAQGKKGLRGDKGPQGETGRQGDQGPAGPRGERGPRGEPGPPPSRDWPFLERHIRAKIAWKGDRVMETARVVGSYDSSRQAYPVYHKDDTTGLNYRNWNQLRIVLSVESVGTKNKQIVSFYVINYTNSPLLVVALFAKSCNDNDDSVFVSGIPSENKGASYCISKTDNNEILQCIFPGASGVFKIDFKTAEETTGDTGVLFLADTLQTAAPRPNVFEKNHRLIERAGKFLQKPSPRDIKMVMVSEGKKEQIQTLVASINNPIVRLKLPTAQEINSMYNFSENMDMLKSAITFLKKDNKKTLDENEFSVFLLYFLLHSSVLYLLKTGWDKAGLESTTFCERIMRSGVIDIASGYMVVISKSVSSTFMAEDKLFSIPSRHTINSEEINNLVPELMNELLGNTTKHDLFEPPKTVASMLV